MVLFGYDPKSAKPKPGFDRIRWLGMQSPQSFGIFFAGFVISVVSTLI
jgi:hypothetical protein